MAESVRSTNLKHVGIPLIKFGSTRPKKFQVAYIEDNLDYTYEQPLKVKERIIGTNYQLIIFVVCK